MQLADGTEVVLGASKVAQCNGITSCRNQYLLLTPCRDSSVRLVTRQVLKINEQKAAPGGSQLTLASPAN